MKVDKIIETYVALRDQKSELERAHKASLIPLEEGLEKLELLMLKEMEKAGTDSMKTKFGTAYKAKWTSAKVADWEKVLEYIIDNERFDLLERRVNKTVVQEIGTVPGVDVETGIKVNFRRS